MDYPALCEHLKRHRVRLGLKLTIESAEAGALGPDVIEALKEHKPLVVARVAAASQRAELESWEWGSQPGNGTPPF